MFRLLAVLVVLNFSANADGDPYISSFGGGRRIPAGGVLDRKDLALVRKLSKTGFDEIIPPEERKEQALNQVRKAKTFLALPNADPYNEDALAKLLGSAVYLYSKAFDRPLPTSTLVSDYVKAFKEILEEIEAKEPVTSAPKNLSGVPPTMLDGKMTETETYRIIKWLRESGIAQMRRRSLKELSEAAAELKDTTEEIEREEPATTAPSQPSGTPQSMLDCMMKETETYRLIEWLRKSGIARSRRRGRKEPTEGAAN